MVYAYFDTTVFNHLDDIQELTKLLFQKRIQAVSSPQVIGELSCAKNKAQILCSKYKELCNERILKHAPILLVEEYNSYFLNLGNNVDIFLDSTDDVFTELDNIISGDLSNPRVQDFINSEKIRKKSSVKDTKKMLGHYKDYKNVIGKYLTFESYWYDRTNNSNYLVTNIEELLNRFGLGNKAINHNTALDMSQKIIQIPHWHTALRVVPVLEWAYIKMAHEVKKGDWFDISDAIHCATLDYFVSDDCDLRERCKLLLPATKVMSLKEFIEYLKS